MLKGRMKKVNSPCASVANRNENENGAIKDFFPIQILQYIKGWVSNWVLQLRPAPPLLLLLQTLHISWQDLVSQKKGGRKFAHDFLLMTKLAWFIELVQTRCKVRCQSVSQSVGRVVFDPVNQALSIYLFIAPFLASILFWLPCSPLIILILISQ